MNYWGEWGREGVGRMECSEGRGKWDNCNSIINKYIEKKETYEAPSSWGQSKPMDIMGSIAEYFTL